jgi:hypothetical protein
VGDVPEMVGLLLNHLVLVRTVKGKGIKVSTRMSIGVRDDD